MLRPKLESFFILISAAALIVQGQRAVPSFPQDYPGKPSGAFSPEWQSYFQVTQQLPNVTFSLGRSWAGNIPVERAGHPNNTLFFWAFEKENGSLTSVAGERANEPWGIWLNGGPGSSSLAGLLFENGPIHIAPDYTVVENGFAWSQLADYVWIDQPVGTGFATADATGFTQDEEQVAIDFWAFIANLVNVFPSLKTRPLYLTGESYSGTYIPYLTKAYFGLTNPPVQLAKIAIGDGTLGSGFVFEELPTLSVIETYPQLIGYDTTVYEYFKEQSHLCGYDLNLTYPQQSGKFPTINPPVPGSAAVFDSNGNFLRRKRVSTKQAFIEESRARWTIPSKRSLQEQKRSGSEWVKEKRDLTGRANGTIDPWYQCLLYEEMIDYALNFSLPWSIGKDINGFDVYNVPDALLPEAPMDAAIWLNDNVTRSAIHAPTSKDWIISIQYPFGGPGGADPSPEPMVFLDQLFANASQRNVGIVIYSGNDDSLVAHRGSEVVIQNTTFGGIQGFSRKPSTPWYSDDNQFAGIVHQERNLTFVLFQGAGHLVPQQQPKNALTFLREFVLGSNQTGLVVDGNTVSVVGGEDTTVYANGLLAGESHIFTGVGSTAGSTLYPSQTIAAWESFIATALPSAPTGSNTAGTNGAVSVKEGGTPLVAVLGLSFAASLLL
ncbi:Alpha/Beta hydrolase protein [Abortiporus biennis]|nr:Alpha/Beta hydrolase protein [Abortiporus biennis]